MKTSEIHTRRPEHGQDREDSREKPNLFSQQLNSTPQGQIMLKRKLNTRYRLASEGFTKKAMEWLCIKKT